MKRPDGILVFVRRKENGKTVLGHLIGRMNKRGYGLVGKYQSVRGMYYGFTKIPDD